MQDGDAVRTANNGSINDYGEGKTFFEEERDSVFILGLLMLMLALMIGGSLALAAWVIFG